MTPQIKQRIEQIQRGELPAGYKKTKVGVVPSEWKETTVNKCVIEYVEKTTVENQYPVLTSARSGLMLQSEYYSNNQVTTNDNIGYNVLPRGYVTYRSRSDDGKFRFNENQIIDRGIISYFYPVFSFNSNVSHKFMLCLLNHTIYRQSYSFVEGTAQQVLSFKKLGSLKYCLPSLAEQEKIAKILSAQDKLITLKEKLIEEKKRQKKALMQQLLTGKKRLPGFEYSWEMHTLKTMSTPILRKAGIGQYEILSISAGIGFVNQAQKFGKEIAGEQYKNYTVLQKHEFSYNKGNSKRYPQGCIYPLENRDRAAVPNVFISFNLDETRCFYGFYKYLFESGYLNKQLYRLINSGVRNDGLLNLYDCDFYNCVIPVPSYDEQKKIANIFFSLDKEIISLEKTLQAEKQKKKALMQLLLTGIVRV